MNNDLTANITYKGIEDKGITVNVIDENGKKWKVWKKNKGSDELTDAYAALKQFEFGESFGVTYYEKEESFEVKEGKDKGKTINFTSRTISDILPLINNPTQSTVAPVTHQNAPGRTKTPEVGKDTNWDEIAVGKCQTAFLAAYIQSGKSISDAKLQVTQARQLAELVVYGHQQQAVQNEPPLEEPPLEDDVSNIPF